MKPRLVIVLAIAIICIVGALSLYGQNATRVTQIHAARDNSRSSSPPSQPMETSSTSTIEQIPMAADQAYGRSVSGETDFWKYANAMKNSKDPAKVMEARHAVLECQGFAALNEEMASFVSGGKSKLEGRLTPERQLAFSSLTSKCNGFRVASRSDVLALKHALNDQAQKVAPNQFSAAFASELTAKQKIEMLYSGSGSAIAQSLPKVAKDWAISQGLLDRADERRDDMLTASFLAACDLGTDCSPNGFETQLQCVLNGECQQYWQGIEAGLSEDRRQRVAQYRSQLVRAASGKDISLLGLSEERMTQADAQSESGDSQK